MSWKGAGPIDADKEQVIMRKGADEVQMLMRGKRQNTSCSVPSPWRPHKEDKRMVLEYTHGLFIT
jgi:hypothetical protein